MTEYCHEKMDHPKIVPPGPNTSKYLDPPPPVQILQCFDEVSGPPLEVDGPP